MRVVVTAGQMMRAARERKGLTQAQVAKDCGVAQPTVHLWESDATAPQRKRLRRVAHVYGLKPEDLLSAAAA